MLLGGSQLRVREIFLRSIRENSVSSSAKPSKHTKKSYGEQVIRKQLKESVVIPFRQERSKTALLEALASTTNHPIQPDYKALSSPQFWGLYGSGQRKDLARRSGEQAANYVIQKYPSLFEHDWEADNVETWLKMVDNQNKVFPQFMIEEEDTAPNNQEDKQLEDSVDSLEKLISLKKPTKAALMFVRLRKADTDVPTELINHLIGFLGFYRASNEDVTYIKENSGDSVFVPRRRRKVDMELLENVIDCVPSPTPEQLHVLLRAYVLNMENKKAHFVPLDRLSKLPTGQDKQHSPMNLKTRNYLISSGNALKEPLKASMFRFRQMQEGNVRPNHETFTSFLKLAYSSDPNVLLDVWSSTLNEMNALGIEPGPSVMSSMFLGVMRLRDSDAELMRHAVLDYFHEKEFTYQQPMDVMAFFVMMSKAAGDFGLATKIFRLANFGKNSKLFRNSTACNSFFSLYLKMACKHASMDELWRLFNIIVPAKVTMSRHLYGDLMNAISQHQRPEYLPLLYCLYIDGNNREAMDVTLLWLRQALQLYDCADLDTRTQFKHIAIISQRNTKRMRKADPRGRSRDLREDANVLTSVVNGCVELVARSGDVPSLLMLLEKVFEATPQVTITPQTMEHCTEAFQNNESKAAHEVTQKMRNMIAAETSTTTAHTDPPPQSTGDREHTDEADTNKV